MQIECLECGQISEATKISDDGTPRRQYCSDECYHAVRRRLKAGDKANKRPNCIQCGTQLGLRKHRFCSDSCAAKHRHPRLVEVQKRDCSNCGIEFEQPRIGHKKLYCSGGCQIEAANKRRDKTSATRSWAQTTTLTEKGTNKHVTGSIGELIVAADLMVMGYQVFQPLHSNGNPDLLARINGKYFNVEVKVGRLTKSGNLEYGPLKPTQVDADIVAVVKPDRTVKYFPPLE